MAKIHFLQAFILFLWILAGHPLNAAPAAAPPPIETFETPRYAKPPRHPDDSDNPAESTKGLRFLKKRKAAQRQQRENQSRKPETPWEERITRNLKKDTLAPRERQLLVELSLVAPYTVTQAAKSGYSHNPTTHFLALWRKGGQATDGKGGAFYGFRLAPFSGTGYYQKKPGSFGLLFFGPVFGWGSLDKAPEDQGQERFIASGTKPDSPSTSGYVFSMGLAAVHRQGLSDTTDPEDSNNDFGTRGVLFDPPGLWMEYRWLSIRFGGLALNTMIGVQTGRDKVFAYFGLGTGGWN